MNRNLDYKTYALWQLKLFTIVVAISILIAQIAGS